MSQSVFKCSTWLTGFLQRRGVQQPDQRGLYEYHCSYEEYIELQQLLVQLGSFDVAGKDMAGCACFVLFCSEVSVTTTPHSQRFSDAIAYPF